jgi:hypothetical protein
LGKQLKIADALSDGYPELVGIDHARKAASGSLPKRRFAKQVVVLREQNAPEITGSIQEFRVR